MNELSLEELKQYRPPQTKQPDFDTFWEETLSEGLKPPLNVELNEVSYPTNNARVYELHFDGWQGARIRAWYVLPPGNGPFPALCIYEPYNYYVGYPYQFFHWTLQGYAVLGVSTRGQPGGSLDSTTYPGHVKGWMTAGIHNPREHYYRGAFVDAVRALEVLAQRPEIDAEHIAVTGTSQGGGLSLAAAALSKRPCLAMPDVPYLCHFRRAVEVAERQPYLEIREYLRFFPDRAAMVFQTLSYFDNLNLCDRITCPTLMNVGLLDDICPPSTIFAVYNRMTCPKELAIYPYHNHEFILPHVDVQLRWTKRYLEGKLGV